MRDGFKVIDLHVLEPSDLFANYLPGKFRDRVRIEGRANSSPASQFAQHWTLNI